jgi:hypothetical protein
MMIEIGKALVSLDVLREKFCCDLPACLGSCCVHGDAGAPLTATEAGDLEDFQEKLAPFLSEEGLLAILDLGAFVPDTDGEIVTPLINNRECAYTRFREGVAFCAIEDAWNQQAVPFHKPVSCHLYPIRIKEYEAYDAVNYDVWDICGPARRKGAVEGVPVYLFVREALIRKYGEAWFEQLDYAAKNLDFEKFAGA